MIAKLLIESLLPASDEVELAHYTSIGTLCHLMPESNRGWSSAWAAPVQFLNDRLELSLGLEILADEAAKKPNSKGYSRVANLIYQFRSFGGSLDTDVFQMSFSKNLDEIGQWRGYASNGMGCSVVTSSRSVRAVADASGWVKYTESEQRVFARQVLERLSTYSENSPILQSIVTAASFIKHPGFAVEEEYRLLKFPESRDIFFRSSGDRLVPYVDFLSDSFHTPRSKVLAVDRIILGPGWQLVRLPKDEFVQHHVVQAVKRLLDSRGLSATSIIPSTLPYDPK